MGFKGKFERLCVITNHKYGAHFHYWSLTITCTNLLMGETIDFGLFPSDGSQPQYYRNQHFRAGESRRIDYQTVNWSWHQDDYAAILGPGNKIIKKFVFHMEEYGPGECPECHGTGKCGKCRGNYMHIDNNLKVHSCDRCNNGRCPTCDIPYRDYKGPSGSPTGLQQF